MRPDDESFQAMSGRLRALRPTDRSAILSSLTEEERNFVRQTLSTSSASIHSDFEVDIRERIAAAADDHAMTPAGRAALADAVSDLDAPEDGRVQIVPVRSGSSSNTGR